MKDTDTTTPKGLAESFTIIFSECGLEKDNPELLKMADICLQSGIEEASHILRLMKAAWDSLRYTLFDRVECYEKHKELKDMATLAYIFKDGCRIKIKATMPDGDFKEKSTTFKLEASGLQPLLYSCLDSSLARHPYIAELLGRESDTEEALSDEELATIIKKESDWLAQEKAMKGRPSKGEEKEIPTLGYMVQNFIKAGGSVLASLTITEKYCLIGDLMMAAGLSPVRQDEWEEVLTNKEKADMVKNWEKSYLTTIGK